MTGYRLQALLELRQRAEREAERSLAVALQALAEACDALEAEEAGLAEHRLRREARAEAHLQEALTHGVGGAALSLAHRHAGRLRTEEGEREEAVLRRHEAVTLAEHALALRRQELLEAARERKALERHREAWECQVRAERERAEELARDDTSGARFLRK